MLIFLAILSLVLIIGETVILIVDPSILPYVVHGLIIGCATATSIITFRQCKDNYKYNMMIEYEELGIKYFKGKGVNINYEVAYSYFEKAVKYNSLTAMWYIGNMYDKGIYFEQDFNKAFEWYLIAAEAGHARAQNSVGNMYETGEGVKKDLTKALDWYILSYEQGNKLAKENLQILSEKIDTDALYKKGLNYKQENKISEALDCFRRAFFLGNKYAKEAYDEIFNSGELLKNKYLFEKVKKYSKKGDAYAVNEMGRYYFSGVNVEKNYNEAIKWFKKGIKLDSKGVCEYNLGLLYDERKVLFDNLRAKKYFLLASKKGYAKAYGLLAQIYIKEKDVSKYIYWVKQGVASEDPRCLFLLGAAYENGVHYSMNLTKAKEYYEKAKAKGFEPAAEFLEKIKYKK